MTVQTPRIPLYLGIDDIISLVMIGSTVWWHVTRLLLRKLCSPYPLKREKKIFFFSFYDDTEYNETSLLTSTGRPRFCRACGGMHVELSEDCPWNDKV